MAVQGSLLQGSGGMLPREILNSRFEGVFWYTFGSNLQVILKLKFLTFMMMNLEDRTIDLIRY